MTFLLTRRATLKLSLGGLGTLLAGAAPGTSYRLPKLRLPKLSFSTLGCPAWPMATILKTAVDSGYQGVEFRGLQGELDLPKCPEFSTAARIAQTRRQFADQGIQIIGLGSSAQLHHAEPAKRKRNLDDARRFIDLAQALNCPYVRVFPDQLPPEQPRELTLRLIAEGLRELGDFARQTSVTVLLESHGELTHTALLLPIMEAAEHPHVGLIWDVFNMWADSHEAPKAVYEVLKKYIRHTHIKDARLADGKHKYVPVGQGEAPLREAISALAAGGYEGYYSFEWEKLWHPDIDAPELVIPQYPAALKTYF